MLIPLIERATRKQIPIKWVVISEMTNDERSIIRDPSRPLANHRSECPLSEDKTGGEGGIRTPGRLLHLRRFSKALLSTTQPPLPKQNEEQTTDY